MIVDKNIAELICELEYKMGAQTYNPNSYNGWTGEEGCGFRYPVKYCQNKEDLQNHILSKTRYKIAHIDPECIGTMKYPFGSNHLYVGDGIVAMLNYLEKKYNIDFNKLEQKDIDKRKKNLLKIISKLGNGDTVKIDVGKKVAGIDIPIGKMVVIRITKYTYLSLNIYSENHALKRSITTSKDEDIITLQDGDYIEVSSPFELKKYKE